MKSEKQRCEARVSDDWGHSHQCHNSASVQRDGKWYCKVHDPEFIKQRNEERRKKWGAEWAESEKLYRRQGVIRDLVNGFSTSTLSKHTATIREFIQGLEV